MSSDHRTGRSVKIRRRGRHAAPSQVEKIAGKATVAAPVVAIAGGIIIGAPATASAATTSTAAVSAPALGDAAAHAAQPAHTTAKVATAAHATLDAATTSARSYEVKPGDTLAGISRDFYGNSDDWHYLYQQNTATISDPNLIYPGQVLDVPSTAPKAASVRYVPRHASMSDSESDGSGVSASVSSPGTSVSAHVSVDSSSSFLSGTLGCSSLESLWEEAGGSPSAAFMAASIAMAESGGNQFAVSPTSDYGYWQINASHGSEATFNPLGNAQAAVSISSDGTNWSPWTTYQTGAYNGKC
jgi:LysM repeat protein